MAKSPVVVDTTEFVARMKLYTKLEEAAELKAMTQIGEDLLKEAGNLSPVDEGTLIGSGSADTKRDAQSVVTTVGYNTPYATRVHYEMVPAPHAKMQPGPRTSAKPGTEFGPAGGLYLTRPLIGKRARYAKHVAANVKKGTEGK